MDVVLFILAFATGTTINATLKKNGRVTLIPETLGIHQLGSGNRMYIPGLNEKK